MARNPPCPDPDLYIWVETREGGYWRLKRGMRKKATLNAAFERNARLTRPMNDAAKRIHSILMPHLNRLSTERFFSSLGGKLKKAYNERGNADYSYIAGLDIQPSYPLARLLPYYQLLEKNGCVEVRVIIDEETVVKRSKIVTHYFLELILVEGDALLEDDLRLVSVSSDVYAVGSQSQECVLAVTPTREPWMVLLKVNCIETATLRTVELGLSCSSYGLKIVRTGG